MNRGAIGESEAQLLVVAESLLSRAGLTALLEERGCFVLAQVDGAGLERHIQRFQPDALVVDFGWDSELMRRQVSQAETELPLLALVATDAGTALGQLLQTLRLCPQFALLPRDSQPDLIVSALEALAGGLCAIEPSMTSALALPVRDAPEQDLSPLTAREHEVLQLLARGMTNRAIAHELGITQHTVKFHVNAIMGKLDAQSRTEAVVRATQLGMIVL